MIPVTFEEAAERSRARRVVDAEIVFIRERSREALAGVVEVRKGDPAWPYAERVIAELDGALDVAAQPHRWCVEDVDRVDFERKAADVWRVTLRSARGLSVTEECFAPWLFEAWGLI